MRPGAMVICSSRVISPSRCEPAYAAAYCDYQRGTRRWNVLSHRSSVSQVDGSDWAGASVSLLIGTIMSGLRKKEVMKIYEA